MYLLAEWGISSPDLPQLEDEVGKHLVNSRPGIRFGKDFLLVD